MYSISSAGLISRSNDFSASMDRKNDYRQTDRLEKYELVKKIKGTLKSHIKS